MVTAYEIKPNGYLGRSMQIDPKKGLSARWTFTAPPTDGPHKWVNGSWSPRASEPPASTYGVNTDELEATVRDMRNALLAASDWTQVADAPVDQVAWAEYRQALRDVPSQEGFPMQVEWPVKPGSGS